MLDGHMLLGADNRKTYKSIITLHINELSLTDIKLDMSVQPFLAYGEKRVWISSKIIQQPFVVWVSLHINSGALSKLLKYAFFGLNVVYSTSQQRAEYLNFMKKYVHIEHMSLVQNPYLNQPNYYLPHQFVYRPKSTLTKMRLVFCVPSKTSTGVSLNDISMTALTGDIKKMYRKTDSGRGWWTLPIYTLKFTFNSFGSKVLNGIRRWHKTWLTSGNNFKTHWQI